MKSFTLILTILYSISLYAVEVKVGSKAFTEGYLLGELGAKTIENVPGVKVKRRFGLGSTGIVIEALLSDEIDVYPEYTGTITETILHDSTIRDDEEIQKRLHEKGLVMSQELGFENTYGLAVRRAFAEKNNLQKISDLKGIEKQIRAAFSPEFISRGDGLKSLQSVYKLDFGSNLEAIDHMLSYETIAENKADLIAVYSTDYKIEALDLVLLQDDKNVFPPYKAVFLAKATFVQAHPEVWSALNHLHDSLNEKSMRVLNGKVERDHNSASEVISEYLGTVPSQNKPSFKWKEIKRRTKEHLLLVSMAVLFSILVGLPLGILSCRYQVLGQAVLIMSSVVQTIPSLALLSLLIPLFGIGRIPALIALCLYSLLPVIQNTLIGLQSITKEQHETARALGLSKISILFSIELPLAGRSILGGIRTASIIGIGTATLAALIGAGGYGAPILSGLATNNQEMIFIGAVPCALMSLAVFILFELLNRLLIPKGIRN